MTSASGGADMVDWNLAVATATRLVRPGPEVSRAEAAAVVAELRRHALEAEEHVRAFTGMRSSSLAAATATPVLVVDRPGWVRANVAGFRTVVQPLVEKLQARRANSAAAGVFGAVGEKATGIEVGALLAFLATKVLGQYETFAPAEPSLEAPDSPAALFDKPRLGPEGPGPGRLLLVAPNIVHVERELDVDPSDFRLWVCLHEETHRTQFTAVPWLRDHIQSEVQSFLAETDVDPGALLERLRDAAGSLGAGLPGAGNREGRESPSPGNLLELVQSPAQREILGRLTAVMSLLEGHADVVMDGVGPAVVPTVAEIREKFQQRRDRGANRLDLVLRRLLGMDAKLRQYQDGAVFVRAVVEQVGMEGFNRVWTSPNTLPTKDEIHDPAAWVARVGR
ncbi:zinc-dependent metalloprotease [Kitasatospora aureofaciens]|uniref:Coenzyme F420 biosynthesis-associated protein n=2 Tax=Kitasatospora aureofaciens TaxID=1894 RepID=A0A1E7N769_KITAU|nr:zinc-dependent metalloprotease [Kitasatospora aureofaciens]QEV00376.1 coenzyme F420 biosynthesis-associated protein [Streptomyces viridifaciens]ARF79172.1 coenzyme F420 biosynthesis-associated protein [Kitasatospora aureofaciens]OEV36525.1 coenzyme F420 biosynthesis-associated protein [Kitasatospora aureofaciens]UKZ06601.1 zinc-dependent metalloprotease [Streptomyces viridifaciens]HJD84923.1 zinc-dependent metalloprotease [Kitasatospora aureofaciens]